VIEQVCVDEKLDQVVGPMTQLDPNRPTRLAVRWGRELHGWHVSGSTRSMA
jgi:hypothetical protein